MRKIVLVAFLLIGVSLNAQNSDESKMVGTAEKSKKLDKYLGVYSSPTFPLKITITKEENILIAQATGQPSFPLEPYEENKFKFDEANLKLEFIPREEKMILKQSGGKFEFKKE